MNKIYQKFNRYTHIPFSGFEHYYQLDMNNTMEANAVIQKDDVKFLIHGYTDKVQFNKTGSVPFSNKCLRVFQIYELIIHQFENGF